MKKVLLLSGFILMFTLCLTAQPPGRGSQGGNRGGGGGRGGNNWLSNSPGGNDMPGYRNNNAMRGQNIHPFKNTGIGPVVTNNNNWNRPAKHTSWNGALSPSRPGINQYRPGLPMNINNNYNRSHWWRSIRNMPGNRPPVYWNGHHYYYHDGNFFNIVDGIFQVVLPVVGFLISSLPSGATQVNNYNNYYYYHGVFYRQDGGEYQVVNPPVGACISELPYFAQEDYINGQLYYTYDNVYLVPVISDNGTECYQVVGNVP